MPCHPERTGPRTYQGPRRAKLFGVGSGVVSEGSAFAFLRAVPLSSRCWRRAGGDAAAEVILFGDASERLPQRLSSRSPRPAGPSLSHHCLSVLRRVCRLFLQNLYNRDRKDLGTEILPVRSVPRSALLIISIPAPKPCPVRNLPIS